MNIKLDYTVRGKFTSHYFSGEVYVHITKKEARFVARRHFIWENSIERLDYPYDYDAIETVLKRGTEKARQAIYAEYSLRRDWYELEIEISEDQEELFTNEVIKDYFKHLLTDAIQKKEVMFFNQPAVFDGGWTVHNEPTLTALYEDSIDFFQKYYDGDLTYDAMTIQRRVIRQYEKGLI